ncbi:hypothetical protein FB45DRAFT_480702 [Roridomyces roridus]|uniref:Ketoreductase domain-containing protein n=1 Tax=Roridomyces roridus TaxID=1738132 RepID=A0AAD7FRJ2_9AGAR|nr:hypothetical protein FB45DRAFT_480702 [Roridomyces roridus]
MTDKTVYLVTGANRGIGLGLVTALAVRPNAIIFAGARDPNAPSLKDLASKHPNVHPVRLSLGNEEENRAAIAEIKRSVGQLDVVIANAGIGNYFGPLATTPLSEFKNHWETNTLGNAILFQTCHELLLASPSGAPRFVLISSLGGSIAGHVNVQAAAYGSSKAAANFLVKVMHAEHPTLVSLAIHPGVVPTEMGNRSVESLGLHEAPETMEDSVAGVLARVDRVTTRELSGRFWNFRVSEEGMPWSVATDEIPW